MKIIVAGIDPSLRATGLARGTFDLDTGDIDITDLGLITTEKEKAKQVRRNSDNLARATEMTTGVHAWLRGASVAFAEIPSGAQSASAAMAFGIVTGVLGGVGVVGDFQGRLIQVMPQEVKKTFTGAKNAAKEEMIEEAVRRWPTAPWLRLNNKPNGRLLDKNEHLADACAAIVAGVETDQFKSLVQLYRSVAVDKANLSVVSR